MENNATLIDGSAYNIQFIGPDNIHRCSFDRGMKMVSTGRHKQFCENFFKSTFIKI